MKCVRFLVTAVVAVALCPAVKAQTVLDRTDPAQELETEPTERPEDARAIPVQTEGAEQVPANGRLYAVGAIVVQGGEVFATSDFLDIIDSYSARQLTAAQLGDLASLIAQRVRQRGYIFASASIASQSLGSGVLRVQLDEGVIDEIRFEGADDPAIRAQLEPLRSGRPVRLAELERRLLLADDLSGVYIRRTRYEREGTRGVLIVEAVRSEFTGRLLLENDGSRPIGPERARIDFDANGLLSPFDELDLTFGTVPFQPRELLFGRARYGMVVNTAGTELAAFGSLSSTRPGAYLAERDIFGRSWRAGAEIRHPVQRSRALSMWLEGEFEFRHLRQEREDVLAREDRIPAVHASLYSLAAIAGGRMRGKLTFSRGLDILDATQLGDPLSSRDDASAEFNKLSGWMEWERVLADRVSVELAGRGQLSADPLLSTEEIGLGGTRFLRGYDFRERSGDEGIMGYGELRYDLPGGFGVVRGLQLYAFGDGGVVGNLEEGRGGGSLASAGGGLRTRITRDLYFDAELAFPLTGPRYDTDDKSPKFNLRISHRL